MLHFSATLQLENGVVTDEYDDSFFHLVILRSGTLFIGFQLSYDREGRYRLLTWCPQSGYHHYEVVYPGEGSEVVGPVLIESEAYPRKLLLERFAEGSLTVPKNVRAEVWRHIEAFHTGMMDYEAPKKTNTTSARPVSSESLVTAAEEVLRIKIARQRGTELLPAHTQHE